MFFGAEWLLYAGPVGATVGHAHHTFQVTLAVEGTVTLRDARQRPSACRAAVVPPRAVHAVVEPCASALLLHVPAEGAAGRRLRTLAIPADTTPAWEAAAAPLPGLVPTPELPRTWREASTLADRLLAALGADAAPAKPRHPGIVRVLRRLPEVLDGDVRQVALAANAGLSVGRFSHLFGVEVGTPLRPYVLWLRMRRAAEHMSRGASLTDAAHAAGFSDSAHLSHVFKRMFGVVPSEIAGVVEWVVPSRTSTTR